MKSTSNTKRLYKPDTKNKNCKKVRMLTPAGKYLETFDSIQEAALLIGNDRNTSKLSAALRKGSVLYGYKWQYD